MKNTQLETGPEKDHQSTGMLIHVACQQNQTVRQGVLESGLRLSRRLRSLVFALCLSAEVRPEPT